jgi:L-seryl-tRNA(Ser) seleniumtransferase
VRVVNATGVLLHTNLGRAPLARAAVDAAARAAGFSTLEFDLATGGRGRRGEHVRPLLLALFAPGRPDVDALAVTNAAAALLLALDTLANGKPVAVSRGELVAIGGDFRVPSILARSGATLFEVGTTNRTTEADYSEALDAGAGAILKVRPSNYRIVGFTEEVALADLGALARARGVPLVYDAGAGAPRRFEEPGLAGEPVPLEALGAGADLVCFSGDKVLGGPQAGILLGRAPLVARAAKNPLARALRPDKLVLGALAATLDLHLSGRSGDVPFFRMLGASLDSLRARADRLAARARDAGFDAEPVASTAVAGGGAGTESTLPSAAVALRRAGLSADALAAALRAGALPVVARIEDGRVLLDLRSVGEEEDAELAAALAAVPSEP